MGLIENVNMSSVKAIPMAILPSSQIQRSIDDQIKRGLDKSFPKSNIKVDDDVWNIKLNSLLKVNGTVWIIEYKNFRIYLHPISFEITKFERIFYSAQHLLGSRW